MARDAGTRIQTPYGRNTGFRIRVIQDFKHNKYKYFIVLPVIIYLILFAYKPMYGIIIGFKDFRVTRGIMNSPWVGFYQFKKFFNDIYFGRLIKNTFLISLYSMLWGFPAPILLALLLNELKNQKFKKIAQTVTYMPHFISIVVICGMIRAFSVSDGIFNDIIAFFGGARKPLLQDPSLFRTIYIASGIWQSIGWNSIIYMASISGIDQEQYEAAKIDGANRLQQAVHITVPGITPTIITLFVLGMGGMLSVGSEKILLLYQPLTYEVADVISTYTYRIGMLNAEYSYSTAIGLFNSVINVFFLVGANQVIKRVHGSALF